MGEQAAPFTVYPGGLPGVTKHPAGASLQELWFKIADQPWASLVLVPADSGIDAAAVATSLAQVGSLLRDTPVRAIVADSIDYTSARALADIQPRLEDPMWRAALDLDLGAAAGKVPGDAPANPIRDLAPLPPVGRAIVAIRPIVDEPLGVIIAQAADAVLLCVELGATDFEAARRTVELVGRQRIIGALVVKRRTAEPTTSGASAADAAKAGPGAGTKPGRWRLWRRVALVAAAAAWGVGSRESAGVGARSARQVGHAGVTGAAQSNAPAASLRPASPRRGLDHAMRAATSPSHAAPAPAIRRDAPAAAPAPAAPASRAEVGQAAPARAPLAAAPSPAASAPPEAPPAAIPPGISQAALEATIAGHRSAFDACAVEALADPSVAGRVGGRVPVVLLVSPSGRAEASLEDGELDHSALGACIRRVVSRMRFPAFQGEPVGARLPLVLRGEG